VLSPATRGSSLLYKKVVHPLLTSREKEIDDLIEKTKQQGYSTFLQLFSSGFTYMSNLFVMSAIKGQSMLGTQLKKSLSLNDVDNFDQVPTNGHGGQQTAAAATNSGVRNDIIDEDEEYEPNYDLYKRQSNSRCFNTFD
jgi:receptor expression-enhancing protein 1/2/3/4